MGRAKHLIEDEIGRLCTCGGGISFATEDHDEGCEAKELLINFLDSHFMCGGLWYKRPEDECE